MSLATVTEIDLAATDAAPAHRPQLRALAGRIFLCNHPSNSWHVRDAYVNDDGRTRDAVGQFWRCGSKLCSSCLARQSRLTRAKLREAISKQQPDKKQRYYFATMTMPNPGLSLLETRSIANRAWTLFRKRSLCVTLFRGGAKSEEFTVTAKGFHYHLHLLILTGWFKFDEFRRTWTDCVRTAFAEHDRAFEVNTKDGNLIVVIKHVLPGERSIQEVCKYVTKADSWSKIKRKDLIEICLVRRWSRMFELFGSFSNREASPSEASQTIVHTSDLTDGGSATAHCYWRDKIETMTVDEYLYLLDEKICRAREFGIQDLRNKFPNKHITTFDCIDAEI